jgi:enoyl-CoA hydratase/carnithine racemase
MSDIDIRTEGRAGRITLTRPKALNALSYDMCLQVEQALLAWAQDDDVALVVIDAEGDRAFCAGGDIAELYGTGTKGDYEYGRKFWADEYRLNMLIHSYGKPIVSFMHGFTMGGGVGLGAHASDRIVCENTVISMPECSIGFVPDVGGSYLLARAPGASGTYLGMSCARMDAGDAVYAGFADRFIPQADWPAVIDQLCATGNLDALPDHPAPASQLAAQQPDIDRLFAQDDLSQIIEQLHADGGEFAAGALKSISRNAPLSLAVTLQMQQALRPNPDMAQALMLEYRVAHRIMECGDMLEGIRAAIIDKDRTPQWRHSGFDVPQAEIDQMLAPLGAAELTI